MLERFRPLFHPRGIAVAGASTHPGKFGFVALHNLLRFGYDGDVFPVNRDGSDILGRTSFKDVSEIPDGAADLVFVCTPSAANVELLRACAAKGVRAAFVASAGYGEAGEEGRAQERELVRVADELGVLLVGPNGQGVISTPHSMCAQIVAPYPPPGRISVASQSGNLVSSYLNYAVESGIGISKAVSCGNSAQTTLADFLAYFAADPETDVVLAYLEGVADGARFIEGLRRWGGVQLGADGLAVAWSELLPRDLAGWWMFLASLGAVGAAALLYPVLLSLPDERRRRIVLAISVCANLGILGFFKYWGFFVESLEGVFGAAGIDAEALRLDIVLPVGISFYTFQTMSYTIDLYRGRMAPRTSVASSTSRSSSPSSRSSWPVPSSAPRSSCASIGRQLTAIRTTPRPQLGSSLAIGCSRRWSMADNLAPIVDRSTRSDGPVGRSRMLWIGTSTRSRSRSTATSRATPTSREGNGAHLCLASSFPLNFRLPYFAVKNPSDFWRRWHISLSQLAAGLPLHQRWAGTGRDPCAPSVNLMATMVLGGLWHGAAWNFVVWGFYQGWAPGHRRLAAVRRNCRSRASGAGGAVAPRAVRRGHASL